MISAIDATVADLHDDFRFDVVHAHVVLPDGWAGMHVSKKYKKPLFVTIHGADFYQTVRRNSICRTRIESVINATYKTIVVSRRLKDIASDALRSIEHKYVVIPNGIELGVQPQSKRKLELDHIRNGLGGKFVLLTVGYLIKRKKVNFLYNGYH